MRKNKEKEDVSMDNKVIENNQVTIMCRVTSPFTFSHEIFGEGFYVAYMEVSRTSANVDTLPVMASERIMDVTKDYIGTILKVSGQYRSYNKHDGEKNRLILQVFAREVEFLEYEPSGFESNNIILDGYICKNLGYRKTPLGRYVTDMILAVNRPYGKSDYIPCILWGRNAKFASNLEVGSHVKLEGRIQSRTYTKKISEDELQERIAYEVSVSKLEELD